MNKTINHKCYSCGNTYPEISEEVFNSKESKDGCDSMGKNPNYDYGVRWVEDAFASEIHGDMTKHWECNNCWWTGWWEV